MKTYKTLICRLFIIAAIITSCQSKDSGSAQKNNPDSISIRGTDSSDDFMSAHQKLLDEFSKHKFTSEKQWDSLHDFDFENIRKEACKRDYRYKVMGWHLYSYGTAYKAYNFDLLWAVAYFSYELDPATGSYKNIHNWKTTALVDSAKQNDCKSLLTITSFGENNNKKFLKNKDAWGVLADSVISLLEYRGADGVSLDFENVPKKCKSEFSEFILDFSKKLKNANKDYLITLAIYAIDWNNIFDIAKIDEAVDYYTLMGYDYYGSFSKTTGPVSPLHGSKNFGEYCLEKSVNYYLDKGVDSVKLILGLPYYGAKWQTQSKKIPSKVEEYISSPHYASVMDFFHKHNYKVELDEESMTKYCTYNTGEDKQLWFDDSITLAMKSDWILYKGLGGIAIWALGYDQDHRQLWDMLVDKFDAEPYTKEFSVKDTLHNNDTNPSQLLSRVKEAIEFLSNDTTPSKTYKDRAWESDTVGGENNDLLYTVYGFLPFWNEKSVTEMNFSLLSRIGYYSAIPDSSTGKLNKLLNWDSLDFEKAHADSCKIDLVVSIFGKKNIKRILKDKSKKQNLISDIIQALQNSKGDGVTLDFNGLQMSTRKHFTAFVEELGNSLKKSNPDYFLNIMIPPITSKFNFHFAYDIDRLEKHTNLFLLTGYDFYGKDSKYAGPLAPLYSKRKWSPHNIDASVLKYIGLGVPLEKLVLIYPNFGLQWQTKKKKIPSKIVAFENYISYDKFVSKIQESSTRIFDSVSLSTCFIQEKEDKTYQTWIDDSVAIENKFKYITHNKLGGVGIWALGNADSTKTYWRLIKDHFAVEGKSSSPIIDFKSILKDLDIKDILWIINLLIIFLVLLTVIASSLHCKLKNFVNKYIQAFYLLGLLLFISTFLLIRWTKKLREFQDEAIFFGIILLCIVLIQRTIDKRRKDNYP